MICSWLLGLNNAGILPRLHTLMSSSISKTFHGFFHNLFQFSMTLGLAVFENVQNFPDLGRASDISRKKKKNFAGFSGANSRKKLADFAGFFAGKKSKFAEKSADFATFSRKKVKF